MKSQWKLLLYGLFLTFIRRDSLTPVSNTLVYSSDDHAVKSVGWIRRYGYFFNSIF